MDEEVKKEIGRFRFGVIADLVGHRKLSRGERQRILREKSQAQWDIPHSSRTRISRSTILYWLRRYEESGGRLESLYPDHRSDKDTSRALEAETAQALIRLKQEYRGATLPAVLREAKRRGVVPAQFRVSKATLYRFFKRQGLDEDSSHRRWTAAASKRSCPTISGNPTPCMPSRSWPTASCARAICSPSSTI